MPGPPPPPIFNAAIAALYPILNAAIATLYCLNDVEDVVKDPEEAAARARARACVCVRVRQCLCPQGSEGECCPDRLVGWDIVLA